MTSLAFRITGDNHDNVLATSQVSIPAGEQPRVSPVAAADQIRIGKRLGDPRAVFGKEIRVPLGDVALPLFCETDFTAQVRTRKSEH